MKTLQLLICSLVVMTLVFGLNSFLFPEDEIPFDFEAEAVNLTGTWATRGEQYCIPGGYSNITGVTTTITEQVGNVFKGQDSGGSYTGAINGNQILIGSSEHGSFAECKLINSNRMACVTLCHRHYGARCSASLVLTRR